MKTLINSILVIACLSTTSCTTYVTIQWKSNQGLANTLGQSTQLDAKMPFVGEVDE